MGRKFTQALKRKRGVDMGSAFWQQAWAIWQQAWCVLAAGTVIVASLKTISHRDRRMDRVGARHFHLGGGTGGVSFATRGAVNGLCRTFKMRPTERDLILGGALGEPSKNLWKKLPPCYSPSSAPAYGPLLALTFSRPIPIGLFSAAITK